MGIFKDVWGASSAPSGQIYPPQSSASLRDSYGRKCSEFDAVRFFGPGGLNISTRAWLTLSYGEKKTRLIAVARSMFYLDGNDPSYIDRILPSVDFAARCYPDYSPTVVARPVNTILGSSPPATYRPYVFRMVGTPISAADAPAAVSWWGPNNTFRR